VSDIAVERRSVGHRSRGVKCLTMQPWGEVSDIAAVG
jgi:hypothetical protein